MDQQIHFEVFARKPGGKAFVLEGASEDRARALEMAEEMLELGRASAVRVTKEILDPATGGFKTVTILTKGQAEAEVAPQMAEPDGPLCVAPADLYTLHARERIGRLLEDWLSRNRVTPFELLHRPDLIEKLEASDVELLHAIQKVAVPEAQARGLGTHEVMRHFQELTSKAIERVLKDGRKGVFPDLAKEPFGKMCERLAPGPEPEYRLGGAVAAALAEAGDWQGRVGRLMDLADSAPAEGAARALAFQVLAQPLSEILASRLGLAQLFGPDLDMGASLAALTQLSAMRTTAMVIQADEGVRRLFPPLDGAAARLAVWLSDDAFESVRIAIGQRILRELKGSMRLRPSDPRAEIDILRALAMALTAASGKLLPHEDVREAFMLRSGALVAGRFVDGLVGQGKSALEEARDLVWLLENVIGGANKRAAAGWLTAHVTALRFESEMTAAGEPALARLAALAGLQAQVRRASADLDEGAQIGRRLGELGGIIEASGRICAGIGKAHAPAPQKLAALARMAAGEAAPLGPAADRARAEALRLLKTDGCREALAASPEGAKVAKALAQAQASAPARAA